jgi:hypothetical protein
MGSIPIASTNLRQGFGWQAIFLTEIQKLIQENGLRRLPAIAQLNFVVILTQATAGLHTHLVNNLFRRSFVWQPIFSYVRK